MSIQLTITPEGGTAYILAQSPGRFQDGTPIGPDNMDSRTEKGTLDREPIGAQGIDTEPVGCDRRTLTFTIQRIYATADDALAGYATLESDCPDKGEVKLGGNTLITKATFRNIALHLRGVNVSAVYTFEGY